MTGTNVYAAKKALFDGLAALTAPGQPLEGIQVAYAFPGDVELECVYGGGVRFVHDDETAERWVVTGEVALISVYIRVNRKEPRAVAAADTRCAAIFGQIVSVLRSYPSLGGGMTVTGVTQGQGDYDQPQDETVSVLGVQVRVESQITYGAGG
ncbi:hypothetical protein AB0N38_18850 [Micromonospora aurantiaca]|uniref:DUF3168 domain-containing protein n=1 Tax=Micromonospora aurantiaca (nom. illeg.) TaxID=47850 RepID=A0A6N3JT87_9ACTN|nr:hypothetical protein [Micromonospora aurantiaca]AXH88791.1 hypothetical protein DVH21_01970 [Micromonospora aurantiaca]